MGWIQTVITVVALVVAIYNLLNPAKVKTAKPDDAKPGAFEAPTATTDRVVTEVFGEAVVEMNLIHMGRVFQEPIIEVTKVKEGGKGGGSKKVEQVVGHAVHATFLYAICARTDAWTGFFFQDKRVWTGVVAAEGSASVKTGQAANGKGSGKSRSTVVYRGGAQLSFPAYASAMGEAIPYFHTSLLFFNNAFIGDNVGNMPAYKARVRRIVDLVEPRGVFKGAIVDPASGQNAQNPADMLWLLLVEWLHTPESAIDAASFTAAKNTLYDEKLGFFCAIDEAKAADDHVREILRHVDGVLFIDARTGLWKLKLIREDYDPDELPILNGADHYSDLEFAREGWDDLPTRLEIKHLDLDRWEMVSIEVANPAAAWHVGGEKKKSIAFQWFGSPDAIQNAVRRMERRHWSPLALVKFKLPINLTDPRQDNDPPASRDLWLPQEGDVVKLSYEDPEGVLSFENMIVRVTGISRNSEDGVVTVEGAEDVFAADDIDLVDFEAPDPSGEDYLLEDPPLHVAVLDATPEMEEVASVVVLASAAATGLPESYRVFVDDAYSYGPFGVLATAVLAEEFSTARWADPDVEFALASPDAALAAFSRSYAAWQRMATPAIIVNEAGDDYEVLSIRALVDNGGGSWAFSGVIRDVAGSGWKRDGTGFKVFAAGSRIWFPVSTDYEFSATVPVLDSFGVSKSVDAILVNHFDSSPATRVFHTYGNTVETPYPPGFLEAEKVGAGAGQTHRLTWIPHTRHRGAVGVNADNIPVFDAESEGAWEITIPATPSFGPVYVDVPTYDRTSAGTSAVVYRVRSLLEGRFSEPRDVAVAAG